jgi:hypothetical protein
MRRVNLGERGVRADPEGPCVDGEGVLLFFNDFGGNVVGSAAKTAFGPELNAIESGQSEITEPQLLVGCDEEVGEFDAG